MEKDRSVCINGENQFKCVCPSGAVQERPKANNPCVEEMCSPVGPLPQRYVQGGGVHGCNDSTVLTPYSNPSCGVRCDDGLGLVEADPDPNNWVYRCRGNKESTEVLKPDLLLKCRRECTAHGCLLSKLEPLACYSRFQHFATQPSSASASAVSQRTGRIVQRFERRPACDCARVPGLFTSEQLIGIATWG